MTFFLLIIIVFAFILVVAYLLLEQKGNRMDFYEELQKEDKKEINKILNEEKEKFKIVDDINDLE